MPSLLAQEAFYYWCTCVNFRLASRVGGDVSETADDLCAIADYTAHPIIRRNSLALIDTLLDEAVEGR
jgi:hypothetical protein